MRIRTPSRLHISLIDENGEIGRVDGGIGITISEPYYELEIETSLDKESMENMEQDDQYHYKKIDSLCGRIIFKLNKNYNDEFREIFDVLPEISKNFIDALFQNHEIKNHNHFPICIEFKEELKPHLGYGSKTQLCLAIAKTITELLNIELDIEILTEMVGRGGTSGIGFRSFDQGGFILDCGHRFGVNQEKTTFLPSSASNAKPARTVLRYEFPEDWFILVVTLNVPAGASKTEEVNIFQKYCPIPIEEVRTLSHIILMQLLPGLIEKDLDIFGEAINKIQTIGFKKVEILLQHQKVKDLMAFQRQNNAKCVGMSSFGPTIYSIFDNLDEAKIMLEKIQNEFSDVGFSGFITKANNSGAIIEK